MRQSSGSGRRMRGRPNRNKAQGPPNRNSNFESNGPEGRVRGNASQVYEKYLTLGREAVSASDRVMAEAFYQHAEHYYRLMNETMDPLPAGAPPRPQADDSRSEGPSHEAGQREDVRREDARRDDPRRDDRRRDNHRRPRPNGAGGDVGFKPQPQASAQPDLLADTQTSPSTPAAGDAPQARPRLSGADEAQAPKVSARSAGEQTSASSDTSPISKDGAAGGNQPVDGAAVLAEQAVASEEAPQRPRRGRPRKQPVAVEQPVVSDGDAPAAAERPRRGRPRKQPVEAAPEQEASSTTEVSPTPCKPQATDV